MTILAKIGRTAIAFACALAVTYVLSTVFYTRQVLAGYAAIGASFSLSDMWVTFLENFSGLNLLATVYGIGFLIAFSVAWVLRRVITPLAPLGYPLAGAAAVLAAIYLIENQLGGGAGVIGGARTAVGQALQGLAGGLGGLVFSVLRPVSDS